MTILKNFFAEEDGLGTWSNTVSVISLVVIGAVGALGAYLIQRSARRSVQ